MYSSSSDASDKFQQKKVIFFNFFNFISFYFNNLLQVKNIFIGTDVYWELYHIIFSVFFFHEKVIFLIFSETTEFYFLFLNNLLLVKNIFIRTDVNWK